jgi:hypothetical protein
MQTTTVVYLLNCTINIVIHSCLQSAILQLSSLYDEHLQYVRDSG